MVSQALVMEEVGVQDKHESTTRLYFIDHLRAALVILVVLHHVALVYGASLPGFYYVEPPFDDPFAYLVLLVFVLFNQAWFMGAFFLLAGYFTPGAYDRKGAGAFLKARLLRLGVPLLFYAFVLEPISRLGWWLMPTSLTGITEPPSLQSYPQLVGLGPLWFVAMLLIFNFGYAAWRWLTRTMGATSVRKFAVPGYFQIGLFIVMLAAASYLMRMVIPLGMSVFEFPTLAYLPQYLLFFMLGAVASRNNWFQTLPGSVGIVGFAVALLSSFLLFPLAMSSQWFSLELTPALENAMGNGHWQSAVYVLWDSTFSVGMVLGLMTLFRRFFAGSSAFGSFLARHSYTVYLIHIPIIVFLAYALRGIALGTILKSLIAAAVIVPGCFAVAFVVRRIPGAARLL